MLIISVTYQSYDIDPFGFLTVSKLAPNTQLVNPAASQDSEFNMPCANFTVLSLKIAPYLILAPMFIFTFLHFCIKNNGLKFTSPIKNCFTCCCP